MRRRRALLTSQNLWMLRRKHPKKHLFVSLFGPACVCARVRVCLSHGYLQPSQTLGTVWSSHTGLKKKKKKDRKKEHTHTQAIHTVSEPSHPQAVIDTNTLIHMKILSLFHLLSKTTHSVSNWLKILCLRETKVNYIEVNNSTLKQRNVAR